MNERIAKQMYIRKTKHRLHDIELVVNFSCPFLPDALVCDNEVTGMSLLSKRYDYGTSMYPKE